MASQSAWIPMVVGGVFVLLGLLGLVWGRREEKTYYDALTSRRDLREFFTRWPGRPEPGAVKAGGWIAIAVGLVMLIVGVVFALIE